MSIRILSAVFLIATLGVGQEGPSEKEANPTVAPEDVTVMLKAGKPTDDVNIKYSRARPLVIEATVPRFLFEIPKFQDKKPVFFRVALGETKGAPFYAAIDREAGVDQHNLLYIDRNRDQDLTNDGPPIKARISSYWQQPNAKVVEFLGVTLDAPYSHEGGEVKVDYPCIFYYIFEPKKPLLTVQVERAGWRQGTIKLGKQDYVFVMLDDDCDGNYTTGDSWAIRPKDTAVVELMRGGATRSMLFPSWSKDEKLMVEVKSVDLAGRRATLRVKPAKETESVYFMRVATARQTPEERQLKLDPMRPKADKGDTVKWLRHKRPIKEALRIGNSPNVNKRVLLDFTQRNCKFCALMGKYTFRDREVVALTEKFVCSKVPFQQGGAAAGKYGVEGTPTYIVLAKDGTEITRQVGWLRPTDFAAWIKSALR